MIDVFEWKKDDRSLCVDVRDHVVLDQLIGEVLRYNPQKAQDIRNYWKHGNKLFPDRIERYADKSIKVSYFVINNNFAQDMPDNNLLGAMGYFPGEVDNYEHNHHYRARGPEQLEIAIILEPKDYVAN